LSLAQVRERLASLAAMRFNGDGIVSSATAGDDKALAALVERIGKAYGTAAGADGVAGIARKQAESFYADLRSLRDWHAGAEALGCGIAERDQALAAARAVDAVQAKVDDFFARTRLA
ncbi:hypothetical protein ABXL43_37395, partial [Burkholderia sola]